MELDFTIYRYEQLLQTIIASGYGFQSFEEFLSRPSLHLKSVILRHDVDLMPNNSLNFAKIQSRYNVKGVYYFRAVPESWDENIIKEIASLGHEIGYHYECLTTCKGNFDKAIIDFEKNLTRLRNLAPVKTICMHGSPMSKYDSKDLWKHYNYRDFGIIGEPYFDVDFSKVCYLTDTGRKWDGEKESVRDKVKTNVPFSFHTTSQIIEGFKDNKLPNQVMFTFHPQRWNNNYYLWAKELVLQNFKNIVKRCLFVKA